MLATRDTVRFPRSQPFVLWMQQFAFKLLFMCVVLGSKMDVATLGKALHPKTLSVKLSLLFPRRRFRAQVHMD